MCFACVVGSGKSYTMMGSLGDETTKGIIPRLCDTLFDKIAQVAREGDLLWLVTHAVCVCLFVCLHVCS